MCDQEAGKHGNNLIDACPGGTKTNGYSSTLHEQISQERVRQPMPGRKVSKSKQFSRKKA
jgi:hypothetical protein